MIIVYWLEHALDRSAIPCYEAFAPNEIRNALERCELLRKCDNVTHVCIQSQLPESVGKDGVAESINYNWFKRRIDPAIQLGRNLEKK